MSAVVSKLPAAARIVLGLIFFVFGLNGFLHFLPMPPMEGRPGEFFAGLVASGYLLPLLQGTEVAAGALLLAGRFVPLALLLLAPIIVNIFAFHAVLAPSGMGMTSLIVVCELYLGWAYRDAFRPALRADAKLRATGPERTHASAPATV